jgi:eukaryotic-like serine/threonine-protein kinase
MSAAGDRSATPSLGDLDEFRLLRALGHGGMGTVFLGHDTVLDRLVAIKLIRARAVDEAARLRFLTEARAIARLSHPNVVTIYRTATTRDGQPYIAQEWISGQSLDRMPLPFDPRRAAEIGLGVARGLAAAHRRGILHRDVKPANVMIDESGRPKLLDFGLAKLSWAERPTAAPGWEEYAEAAATERASMRATDPAAGRGAPPAVTAAGTPTPPSSSAAASALTSTAGTPLASTSASALASTVDLPGVVRAAAAAATGLEPVAPAEPFDDTVSGVLLGTPRYLAPEVWAGGPATARSDIYSFGALLYELVAGVPPHPQETRDTLEDAVLRGPPPPALVEVAPGTDADLGDLVADCIARLPGRRPESSDEIVHRLERILSGAPAVPEGNPYPGLAPFDAEHRAVFYGRGTDVSAVLDRLRAEPVVVVAGDSGIGKSSLCRAGVIPSALAGALGDGRAWRTRTVVFGRDAAAALRDVLGLSAASADPTAAELRDAIGLEPSEGLLLFIDQFEEIVTLNDPVRAGEAARLLAGLAEGVPGLKLLIAVRGDFLTRVASLPDLGPLLTRSLHLLRVLGQADARQAVIGPARAKGIRFESDAMIHQLTAAIDDSPGSLPLLQFALAELWQRRDVDRGIIRQSALDQIGGVAGGLARHADTVVTALGPAERAAARRILLGLVTADGTRASRERLELVADGDQVAAAALEALVRGRLVVARDAADGQPLYTLAHESLLDAWVTLRGWLDDAAGQRGLRTRLGTAADEWHRLDRRADLLWGRAQVAEAAGLDELTARDRDFLRASRRAYRRRRAVRLALIATIPIAVAATWGGFRMRDQARRDSIVEGHLATSAYRVGAGEQQARAAAVARDKAMQLFDAAKTDEAEEIWIRARTELSTARTSYRIAAGELEAALLTDGGRADVRQRMARVIFEQALLAEREGDHPGAAELAGRLAAYDEGALVAEWSRPAALTLEAPGAARIEIHPYADRAGTLELGPLTSAADGERLEASLAPGSYQVGLRGRDGLAVSSPVVLARGERLALSIPLPRASQLPEGFVYIPAGRFKTGSSNDDFLRRYFLTIPPTHEAYTGAYLIGRHEVTFADWMIYMRALPAAEREKRRPRPQTTNWGSGVWMRLDGDGPFTLVFQREKVVSRAAEGEPLPFPARREQREVRWERLPVSGVSFDDARAYAAWLAASRRVPGARLCSELEWERAARGADGRNFPHGQRLDAEDANIDITYDRELMGWGPAEVGSHPRSTSPFGVADMTGNLWEWVPGPDQTVAFRGGSWYHSTASALTANRDVGDPAMRSPYAGVRVCADPPALR